MQLWAKLRRIRHVYFSNTNDLLDRDTMTDFEVSDLLVSDTSSIQYEYLVTGKPIVIARSEPLMRVAISRKSSVTIAIDASTQLQNIPWPEAALSQRKVRIGPRIVESPRPMIFRITMFR